MALAPQIASYSSTAGSRRCDRPTILQAHINFTYVTTIGSPLALTPAQVREAKKLFDRGRSKNNFVRILRVDNSTLYHASAEYSDDLFSDNAAPY